jgi:proteic killer suppression protein
MNEIIFSGRWLYVLKRLRMIKKFRHKGLKTLFESGSAAGIQNSHEARLRKILALLETASTIEDMELPGLKLHD